MNTISVVRGRRPAAAVIEVDGGTSIRDLSSQYGIELPGDAGFETLAGFLLFKLGRIPTPGDSLTHDGRTFVVEQMERNRIARVKIVTRASVFPNWQAANPAAVTGAGTRCGVRRLEASQRAGFSPRISAVWKTTCARRAFTYARPAFGALQPGLPQLGRLTLGLSG